MGLLESATPGKNTGPASTTSTFCAQADTAISKIKKPKRKTICLSNAYGGTKVTLYNSIVFGRGLAMQISILDWVVVAAYFLLNIGIGFYYKKRAGSSVDEFFLSGRDVPWWLAGTSMVATTFAADTPLAVTGMVARNGIAGNWLWWNFVASGMLTVFFYARLWRRSGVMTDVEFAEIRYAGKPAAFLRGFRALYLGLPINCIILGWVNLAMVKILEITLGVNKRGAIMIV